MGKKNKRKYRLRPWVKVAITFVVGVSIIASIFSVYNAFAKENNDNGEVLHGIIKTSDNGKYHVHILEEYYGKDVTLISHKEYEIGQVVTIYIEKDKIVKTNETSGRELKNIMQRYGDDIFKYRSEILFNK